MTGGGRRMGLFNNGGCQGTALHVWTDVHFLATNIGIHAWVYPSVKLFHHV